MISATQLANGVIGKLTPYFSNSQAKLAEMEGESIKWIIDDLALTFVVYVCDKQLLVACKNQPTNATIRATAKQVIQALKKIKFKGYSYEEIDINIEGNPLVVKRFANLFLEANLDYEQFLSDRLGEFPAHTVTQFGRYGKEQVNYFVQRMRSDVRRYREDERC